MYFKYSSTANLKQFSKTLSKHVHNRDFCCQLTGTVKVHGMGSGINVCPKGIVSAQVHDNPAPFDGKEAFGGWRDWAKDHRSVFETIARRIPADKEGLVLSITGEFFGGKVQTTGSVAYAPNPGWYIFDVSYVEPNPDFDSSKNQTHANRPYNKYPVDMERLKPYIEGNNIYLAEAVMTVKHVLTNLNMSYLQMKQLFDADVAKVEECCPFGKIVNPDGNLTGEGYVYTALLPSLKEKGHAPAVTQRRTTFKVRGEKHKRKPGHTLTGVDNAPLNAWALESDALSNDRLQQVFDKIHAVDGFVPGKTGDFIEQVMADIEKECYVFLDGVGYKNVTPFLIESALRRPVSKWYKETFSETFHAELAALEEEHKSSKYSYNLAG